MQENELNHFEIIVYKITNECNGNCSYCYEKLNKNKKELTNESLEVLKKIDKKNINQYSLIFHGGEPLLKTNQIIKTINSLHNTSDISIQTNGKLLNYETINKIQKETYKTIKIGVSLDSLENDARNSKKENIKIFNNILELKNRYDIGILITLNTTNIMFVFDLLDELIKNDIKKIKINNVYGDYSYIPTKYEIGKFWTTFMDDYFDNIYEENSKIILNKIRRKGMLNPICNNLSCGKGTRIISIDSDGQLKTCGRQIYSDNKIELKNDFNFICNNCKYRLYCGNGCSAWNCDKLFFENECEMNRRIIFSLRRFM